MQGRSTVLVLVLLACLVVSQVANPDLRSVTTKAPLSHLAEKSGQSPEYAPVARGPSYRAAGLNITGNFMPWVCQFCTWSGSESAFATEYAPYASNMTELSTEMYYLSDSCTHWLCSWGYENTTNDLTPFDHSHGIKPLPMIGTCYISTLQAFLDNSANWTGFIDTAVSKAVYLGYGGYNIDWEPDTSCAAGTTTHADGIHFAHFLDQFANASHAHGLIVTVDFAYWDTNFWNTAAMAASTADVFMDMNYQCPGTGFTDDLDTDLSYFSAAHLGEALDPEEGPCTDAQMVEEIGQVAAAGVTNIEWWALDDSTAALDNAHLWTAVHDFVYNQAYNGTTSQTYSPGAWGLNANEYPTASGGQINLFTLGTDEQGYVDGAVSSSTPVTSVNFTLSADLNPKDYRIYEGNVSANGTILSSWQLPVVNRTFSLGAPPGTTPTESIFFEFATAPNGTVGAMFDGANGTYAFFSVVLNPASSSPTISNFLATPNPVAANKTTYINTSATGGSPPYSYAYSGLPGGCSTANLSSLPCTPSKAGNFTVKVTVTDYRSRSATKTLVLVVKPGRVSEPSVVAFSAAPNPVTVGNPVNFTVVATGGGLPYTYSYIGLPPGCKSVNSSSVVCTPTVPANYSVKVSVADVEGATANRTYVLEVIAAVAGPSIKSFSIDPSVINLGNSTTLSADVTGGTTPYSYSYSGMPQGCQSENSSSISCTPTSAGTFTIELQVADNRGKTNASTAVLVVNPPSVSELKIDSLVANPDTILLGNSTTITAVVTGGTAPYKFVYSGLPGGCSSENETAFSCTPNESGTFEIRLTVTDADGMTSASSTSFTVNPSQNAGSTGGFLGLSYIYWMSMAVIALCAAGVAAAVLIRRRRSQPPPESMTFQPPYGM